MSTEDNSIDRAAGQIEQLANIKKFAEKVGGEGEDLYEQIKKLRTTGDVECLGPNIAKTLGKKDVKLLEEKTDGFVAKSGIFDVDGQKVFVKYCTANDAAGMLSSEAAALQRISDTKTLRAPKVLGYHDDVVDDAGHFIMLEPIFEMKPVTHWKDLGTQLAQLHSDNIRKIGLREESSSVHVQPDKIDAITEFGLGMGAYHGLCRVANGWYKTWEECFVNGIVEPMAVRLEELGEKGIVEKWKLVREKLGVLFRGATFQPSLLHGDFHAKNLCEDGTGIISWDPAGYYGHFEMDFLAPKLEKLFAPSRKSFPGEFWEAYRCIVPPEPGEEARMPMYVMYMQCLIFTHSLRREGQFKDSKRYEELNKEEFLGIHRENLLRTMNNLLKEVEQRPKE